MSSPQRARQRAAARAASRIASGASPFTCRIGVSVILATSAAVREDRASAPSVVKPTWLSSSRCSVPPTE